MQTTRKPGLKRAPATHTSFCTTARCRHFESSGLRKALRDMRRRHLENYDSKAVAHALFCATFGADSSIQPYSNSTACRPCFSKSRITAPARPRRPNYRPRASKSRLTPAACVCATLEALQQYVFCATVDADDSTQLHAFIGALHVLRDARRRHLETFVRRVSGSLSAGPHKAMMRDARLRHFRTAVVVRNKSLSTPLVFTHC
jgi:hypothetical protein